MGKKQDNENFYIQTVSKGTQLSQSFKSDKKTSLNFKLTRTFE